MKYIICYDVSDNKCRRQIVKYLEAMAQRIQYSVFLADCSTKRILAAKKKLWEMAAKAKGTSITIAPLCNECQSKVQQYGEVLESVDACIIV